MIDDCDKSCNTSDCKMVISGVAWDGHAVQTKEMSIVACQGGSGQCNMGYVDLGEGFSNLRNLSFDVTNGG